MNSLHHKFRERSILEAFPFPIAYMFAHLVFNCPDPERKVRGIAHTFENALRYLAMLLLAEYSAFPESDQTVNQLLDELKRPSVGKFVLFIREAVNRLDRCGHRWFVAEFPEFFKSIQGATRFSNRLGHQNSIDSLLALRNRLAHLEYDPDWSSLADNYYPILLEFLAHGAFITKYPLLRFLELREGNKWAVAELKGLQESLTATLIEAPDKVTPITSDIYLANSKNDEIMSLHPFVMVHPCEGCAQHPAASGLTEEVFLFNGASADETFFIGVRHHLSVAEPIFRVFRERKSDSIRKTPTKDITQEILNAGATRTTELFLQAQIRQGLYLPEAYVPRATLDYELENFFSNQSTAFLLLGQSGIGKTNILCNWASRLAEKNESVLLLSGPTLDASSLEDSILSNLGLTGIFDDLMKMVETGDLGKLVIIIDDLNQHPQVLLALRQLHNFVCRYANENLKVVFSLRTSHFRQILDSIVDTRSDPDGNSFFSPAIYHTTLIEEGGGTGRTYQQILTRIDSNSPEVEQMYEAYRRLRTPEGSEKAWQFRPLTQFSDLSKNVRDLIRNPWYLRLVMELYDQREVPARIFSTDLLREYCQRMIFSREDTADLAQKLIDMMCEQETTSLGRSELETNPVLKAAMIDSAYEASPYNRLLDDRVLIEVPELTTRGLFVTTRYRVQFAFDNVMEFLIANQCLSMGKPGPEPIQLLLTGSKKFLPYAGAVQAIWCIYAQQDNGDLILDCIRQCDESILKPLIPTLRQLEAHGHSSYQRILDVLSHDLENKSGLILLMLGSGMSVENGIDAQNVAFERLFDWKGELEPAFKFCAGKYLIFGYVIAQREAESAAIYNELQRLYAASNDVQPDYLRFEGQLTPQQKERIFEFGWFAEAYGLKLLMTMSGRTTLIDEILVRLKLEWLPDRMKVDLISLIQFVARLLAVSATEAGMQAAEESFQAEKDRRFAQGLRAFDNVGLDLTAIIEEQMPNAIKEVETELGFLYDAYKVMAIEAQDDRQIVEEGIKLYIEDRSDPGAYLPGKVLAVRALVSNNLTLAQGYSRANNEDKTIEYLLRAEEYLCAQEASGLLLQIYDFLYSAAKKFGANETAQEYATRYLDCDCYLSLPSELRKVVLADDPFPLFLKYLIEPDEVDEVQTRLERIWKMDLMMRCGAWLTLNEKEIARQLIEEGEELESYLRDKVPSYDQLRREQCVLTVIRLLDLFGYKSVRKERKPEQSFRDRITEHLRLMLDSSEQNSTADLTATNSPRADFDPVEYGIVLEHLRINWPVASMEERLMGAAAASVFPAFVPLIHLEDDEELCVAVGKEPGTAKAMSWINSLTRCWCADVSRGRRGNEFLQQKLNAEKNVTFSLTHNPELVLIALAIAVFWLKLKEELAPVTLESLNELSTSVDNLELIIQTIQTNLPAANTWANKIVSDFKFELCEVNKSLLAEFDS